MAVQTYIWWERGAVTPRLSKVAALAQWLDIPEDEVLRKLHDSEIQALRDREQDRPAVTIPEEKGAYLSAATFGPVLAQVA